MSKRTIGLIGYGDILQRVFDQQQCNNRNFVVLSRQSTKHPSSAASISATLGHNSDWEWPEQPDIVVYTPKPESSSSEGYHKGYVEGIRELLAKMPPTAHLILVSSTRVYQRREGLFDIDEHTPLNYQDQRAKALINMEQLAKQHCQKLTILRPSGIYGRNNTRIVSLLNEPEPSTLVTNRIHAQDLASFISFLIDEISANRDIYDCYNVSDESPASLARIQAFLCNRPFVEETQAYVIRANRYKKSGYRPLFDSYVEAYANLRQPQ